MPEKAVETANEPVSKSLGVKCKSSIKAGNLVDDLKSHVDTDALKKVLQDYATFPFSINKECSCSNS